VTEQDTGTDIFTLVRVSHIHLFGLTFIFYLVGNYVSGRYGHIMIHMISGATGRTESRRPETNDALTNLRDFP